MPEDPKGGYTKEPDKIKRQVLSGVLEEYDVVTRQRETRRVALEEMEKFSEGKKAAYIAFLCSETSGAAIDSDDIPAFGDVLMSVGEVDELNLIINSPGGDGTVAEKIIELCRAYCKDFKVIVPNRAKSAATIIALGADQIVMGYCSELGPIDAQVVILVGGVPHYIYQHSPSLIPARHWKSGTGTPLRKRKMLGRFYSRLLHWTRRSSTIARNSWSSAGKSHENTWPNTCFLV